MRGRLSILVIAAALAVGLWYLFAPSDSPEVIRSETDAPVSRPAPADGDPETADAGSAPAADNVPTKETAADSAADGARVAEVDADSATDIARTPEPGATDEADDTLAAVSESDSTPDVSQTSEPGSAPRDDDTLAADSGTDSTSDVSQTSEPGSAPRDDDTLAADSGTDSTSDVAQTSEPGSAPRDDDTLAADSGTDSTSDVAQTSESVAMAAPGVAPTSVTGPAPPADAAGTTDSDAVEAEPQTAAEETDQPATGAIVLAPPTGGTIERIPTAPTGAPPEDETDPEDVLAAVADGIDRLKNVVEETLGIEPEEDTDTALRLRIEYDDTPKDAAQTGLEPKEGAETVGDDATAAARVAPTTDTGAGSPSGEADDTLAADSGTDSTTDVARTSESVAMTAPEVAPTSVTGPVPPADTAGTTDSDAVETEPQTAAEETDQPATGAIVLAPPTGGAIERTPIAPTGAPPQYETDPEDVLVAVADGIDRLKNAIEETLGIEPEEDADTALRLRIEYDDTPTDAPQTGLEPKAGAETVDDDATAAAHVARTTDTDAAQTEDTGTEPPADPVRATGSDETPSTPPLRTADSDSTPPSKVEQTADAGATGDEGPGSEAKQYVETLTATSPPTIPVDKADHFVTRDSLVSLVPEDSIESTTVGDLADDDTLTPETPITVVREVEQIETAVPEQLIADSGGDLDRPLHIVVKYDDTQVIDEPSSTDEDAAEQGESAQGVIAEDTSEPSASTQNVAAEDTSEPSATKQNVAAEDTSAQGTDERSGIERITVREALERMRTEPGKPLSIVRTVRHFEIMTLRELLDSEEDDDAFLKVVLQPYRIEAATLADLLRLHETRSPDTISYLHTVQPTDEQGIWGIVHFGLIENFARGMAVRRGENIETYTVRIPRDADERLEDQSSSFLGKLIDRKTKESYVYNYRENRMGRNPDTIYPGQEIVIINFEPGELEAIYEHFADG